MRISGARPLRAVTYITGSPLLPEICSAEGEKTVTRPNGTRGGDDYGPRDHRRSVCGNGVAYPNFYTHIDGCVRCGRPGLGNLVQVNSLRSASVSLSGARCHGFPSWPSS